MNPVPVDPLDLKTPQEQAQARPGPSQPKAMPGHIHTAEAFCTRVCPGWWHKQRDLGAGKEEGRL